MGRGLVCLAALLAFTSGPISAQSKAEIEEAIARLDGEREDARAMEFLIDAGEAAIERLVTVLGSADEEPHNPKFGRALRVLRAIGPKAEQGCSAFVQATIDDCSPAMHPSPAVMLLEATRIGKVDANGHRLVLRVATARHSSLLTLLRRAELIEACVDGSDSPSVFGEPDVIECELAADLLESTDRAALPRLLSLLEDEEHPRHVVVRVERTTFKAQIAQEFANSVVWTAAAMAIARIDTEHPRATRGLALLIEFAADPRDRVKAAMALGRHGEAAREHVDVLLAALDSDDDRLVAEAATALGMIGVESEEVVDRLRRLVDESPPAIARRAEAALRSLEARKRPLVTPRSDGIEEERDGMFPTGARRERWTGADC